MLLEHEKDQMFVESHERVVCGPVDLLSVCDAMFVDLEKQLFEGWPRFEGGNVGLSWQLV